MRTITVRINKLDPRRGISSRAANVRLAHAGPIRNVDEQEGALHCTWYHNV